MDGLETEISRHAGEAVSGRVVYKMTGSGNDFVMIDGRTSPVDQWDAEQIRTICGRRTGLGADGLAILEPGSEPGAVRFHFFNNDGNRTEMCGNASLCATRLAARLELADPDGMTLETDVGPVRARVLAGPGERAEIVLPDVRNGQTPDIPLAAGERSVHLVMVGVPHLVVEVDCVGSPELDILTRGRELRWHPALLTGGANVNFTSAEGGKWKMRSYERGVEGETLACGTGAVAVAATLARAGLVELPWTVETASGKMLEVSAQSASDADLLLAAPRLAGEARIVYRAVLE